MITRRVLELVEVLKKRSLRVSRAEVDDALRALDVVGADAFVDRASFRAVLQATLIKNAADVDVFDRAFALCFGDPQQDEAQQASSSSLLASALSREQAQQAFGAGLGGADPVRSNFVQALMDGEEAGVRQSLRQGLDELELSGLVSPLQAGWFTSRLLQRMGLDELFAAAAGDVDEALLPALHALEDQLRRMARRLIEQEEQKRSGRAASSSTWDRDLRILDEKQTDDARALLRKLAERLRARVLRRRKKSRRGRLDVRRTLRRSLRTDGVPVVPVLRRRRVEKPALLLLCDVSDSVRASALFLLELCAVLHDLFASTRAFVFVDRLHEVTALLEHGAAAVAASDAVMGGGNSDYGRALHDVDVDAVTRKTVVVVLGDGRSNYRDPALDVAATLKQRAKSVVWLVPEDRGTWGFGDSVIPRYARHADAMLPARTLRDLARAIDRVLR
ncbi:MAG: VWA domain-containing protein [Deltaproteobacteria bacterium]|nr:VWA domain-containing protein [Deltaproteobacteria bacterium]